MSRVTCHVSRVTCHVSNVTIRKKDNNNNNCHKVVELVGGGSVINGAYPFYFFLFCGQVWICLDEFGFAKVGFCPSCFPIT